MKRMTVFAGLAVSAVASTVATTIPAVPMKAAAASVKILTVDQAAAKIANKQVKMLRIGDGRYVQVKIRIKAKNLSDLKSKTNTISKKVKSLTLSRLKLKYYTINLTVKKKGLHRLGGMEVGDSARVKKVKGKSVWDIEYSWFVNGKSVIEDIEQEQKEKEEWENRTWENTDKESYGLIMQELKELTKDCKNDLEKVALVALWIESHHIYYGDGGGSPKDWYEGTAGEVCAGVSAVTESLLNDLGINCYSATEPSHDYNVVVVDGKRYYLDCATSKPSSGIDNNAFWDRTDYDHHLGLKGEDGQQFKIFRDNETGEVTLFSFPEEEVYAGTPNDFIYDGVFYGNTLHDSNFTDWDCYLRHLQEDASVGLEELTGSRLLSVAGDYYPTSYRLGEIIGFTEGSGPAPDYFNKIELYKDDSDVRWYWVNKEGKYATDRLGRHWDLDWDGEMDAFTFSNGTPVDLKKDAIWWGEGEPPM
jgi:hypothetical protein